MRSSVISTFVLALALAPAAAFAQATTTPPPPPAGQQPPAGQPPAQPEEPKGPKLTFTAPVGVLLVTVKPDQTAVFEEMMDKLKSGVATATNPEVSAQAGAWKYYRVSEPAPGGVMYVVMIDPVKPGTEYQFFQVIQETLTDEQKRDPATAEMYKRYAATIVSMNMLNLTPKGQQ